MGFLNLIKKLVNKTDSDVKPTIKPENEIYQQKYENAKINQKASYPSKNGLYPHEILMLSYVHIYKTDNNDFPGFWKYEYAVDNPKQLIDSLISRNFVCLSSIENNLNKLTIAQLKEELTFFGLETSGKKADLVNRLKDNVSVEKLFDRIPDHYYALTDSGKRELEDNDYVTHFHKKQKYGINIWDINKLVHNNPHSQIRDLIWGELNRRLLDSMKEISNGNYGLYISGKSDMCRFLLEENKNEKALSLISEAALLEINIEVIKKYKKIQEIKKFTKDSNISSLTLFDEISPALTYHANIIKNIQYALQLSNEVMHQKLVKQFDKFQVPTRIFSNDETANLIIAKIVENTELIENLCKKAEKQIK